MNTRTRRQLLTVLTGLAGGLAGCAGESVESSRSVSETNRQTVPDDNAAVDPPMIQRRSTTQQPIRLRAAQTQDEGESSDEGPRDDESFRRLRRGTDEVIDTAAKADRLVSNEDGATDGDDSELSAFIAATDFERETLYLEPRQIEQCYRLSLCFVSWEDTEIQTAYGRRLRPYDERCAADRTATEARLIRLPVALDADEINSFGTSIRSGRCVRSAQTAENASAGGDKPTVDAAASSGGPS